MSTESKFLAVFLGNKNGPRMAEWTALPDAERAAREKKGMDGWKAWVETHQSAIDSMGGPLGKTKKVSADGTMDTSNQMGAFVVVRAASHAEAAAMFADHPHFTIFPGDAVEIMPVLPIPGQ